MGDFWQNTTVSSSAKIEPDKPKGNNKTHLDQLEAFKSWVQSVVRIYPSDISTEGVVQRYSDQSNVDTPIRIFCDISPKGIIHGWCMNYRESDKPIYYTPEKHNRLSESQIKEYQAHAEARRIAHELEKETKRIKIAEYVTGLQPINDSPYIKDRKIKATALQGDNCIVLPITDTDGKVFGIQEIYGNGKKIIYGSYAKGKHIKIDGDSSTVLVCEGWATGCTLSEITGHMVFCALSKNGIGPTVKVLKDSGVDSIIIAADNDYQKKINGGLDEAKRVGEAQGVPVVWPEFNGLPGSDWNDLANLASKEEVKRQLQSIDFNPLMDAMYSGNDPLQLQPFDFVIKNFYQIDETNMVFGGGGVGKGILTMIQAVTIVTGRKLIGQDISKVGPVIYYNAEDPINTMLLRLHAILRRYKIQIDDVKDLKLISGRQSAGTRGQKMVLATQDNRIVTKGRDFDNFMKVIETVEPVAIFLDPLIKIHEGCNENSNEDIEAVMGFCSMLQDGPQRFALIPVHHVGKIATEALRSQDSVGRGASAAYDHARSCWLITKPTEEEKEKAEQLGYDPRFLIRLDCKKATNFTMPKETWYSKELWKFDDIKNQDGDPTTVAYIETSNFADGRKIADRKKAIEKENREDMALKWVNNLIRDKGELTRQEIFEAMGPMQKTFWGTTQKTFDNKISKYPESFLTFKRGRFIYYDTTI